MPTTIGRRLPPQRLINLINPAVRATLRSPLHRAVDGALLILHVTGRRTGHRYDIPVGYVDLDGRFVVVTQHRWRANLRGGADIEVTHAGHRQPMHAELDDVPASVADTLRRMIEEIGWKGTQRQTGLTTDTGRVPTVPELEEAVREYDLATVLLTSAQPGEQVVLG
ncbi:nitroreductase/quinone reductase family protein [Krasilnikovia sp. MM14-A1259]|uniref:nitroreductase/quinone reductase family protein n=1 Tax=Krasilnikovia sp. MM14-A1259 TaxID=3373539 RepID=UPI0038134E15